MYVYMHTSISQSRGCYIDLGNTNGLREPYYIFIYIYICASIYVYLYVNIYTCIRLIDYSRISNYSCVFARENCRKQFPMVRTGL